MADSDSFTFLYDQDSTPIVHSVHPSMEIYQENITIYGENFSNRSSDVHVLVGGQKCSDVFINDTVITCTTGVRLAGVYQVQVSVAGLGDAVSNATFEVQLRVTGISKTSGSIGGHQLIVISGSGFHANHTSITLCGEPCSVVNESSEHISCFTPARCNDLSDVDENCTVVLTVPGGMVAEAPSVYTYRTNSTPTVSSVSPQMGEEGTGLTITGHGFSDSQNTVIIGDAACTIISENSSTIQCELGSSATSGHIEVVVTVGNLGRACTDPEVAFQYVHRWTSPLTWPDGTVPQDGDTVTIGPGQAVLLDTNTTVLQLLHINGGDLIFEQKDLEIHAEAVLITGGGSLQVGTAEQPFLHTAHIVLYGDSSTEGLPLYGDKIVVVREGTIDMHGLPVSPSWTRLDETANPGDTNMTLQEPVNWLPGSTVVVAATGDWDAGNQHEEVTIIEVSPDGLTLSFSPPLRHTHTAEEGDLAGWSFDVSSDGLTLFFTPALRHTHTAEEGELVGWSFGLRAVVFPVNRNIVFRDSQNTDTCFQGRYGRTLGRIQHGARLIVHPDNPSSSHVNVHVQNVEFINVGKGYSLGNHPITFRMCGDVRGLFVRNSVIRRSFNRGLAIKGTDNLSLEGNVMYDVKGHGFYTQDGDEENNVFENNLAVMVKQSVSLEAEDLMPAGFLMRHPGNVLDGNVVVGSDYSGFWYNLPARTGGTARTNNVCPRKVPLATFQGNAAYSCHGAGLLVSPTYRPNVAGNCGNSEDELVTFGNFTASGCFRGIHMASVGTVQVVQATIIGSEVAGIEYTKTEGESSTEVPLIQDSVIVATRTAVSSGGPCTEVGIRTPPSGNMTLSGVTLVHFDTQSCAAIGGCPDKVLINNRLTERSYEPLSYKRHNSLQWHLVNNTLSYLVSGKGKKSPTDLRVSVEVYDCIEPTCAGTVYVSRRPRDAVFWSHDSSWRIDSGVRNGQGRKPQEGEDVEIQEGIWMVADVPLPELGRLVIRGTFEVPTEHIHVINVTCIVIIGGRLVIGFEEEAVPSARTISVAIHGGCTLEEVLASRSKRSTGQLENPVGIAVFGRLDLHGSHHLVTWTRLSSTFAAGNNKIRVRDEVDWRPGDEIVVTSTSYDPHQAETFSIRKVGNDRRTLYLDKPLQHTHLGETRSVSDGSRSYPMAAEVGLLSRNLRVIVTSSDDNPPVHLHVGQLTEGTRTYTGTARISDVEFTGPSSGGRNQRSFAMTFTGGSLIGQDQTSYVINSSVHQIQHGGLHPFDSPAINIENNVFYYTVGPTILVEGSGSVVSRNLVCLSVALNTTERSMDWFGAIDVTKADGVTLTANAVAGSERIAFLTSGISCDSPSSGTMEGNVGHSSLHGYRIPSDFRQIRHHPRVSGSGK
ncbi:fibrocystin-L-like [Branchiostoma floridae x Branchiostoma belcheri]